MALAQAAKTAKTANRGARPWLRAAVTATTLAGGFVGLVVGLAAGPGAPTAGAAPDPCAASSITKTVGSVSDKTADYLKAHPETDKAMTKALQQQAGPQSVMELKGYLDANPKVAHDLRKISEPLTALSGQCELPISLPQMLGLMQAAQNQQLPAQLPKPSDVLGKTGRLPGPAAPAAPAIPDPVRTAPGAIV